MYVSYLDHKYPNPRRNAVKRLGHCDDPLHQGSVRCNKPGRSMPRPMFLSIYTQNAPYFAVNICDSCHRIRYKRIGDNPNTVPKVCMKRKEYSDLSRQAKCDRSVLFLRILSELDISVDVALNMLLTSILSRQDEVSNLPPSTRKRLGNLIHFLGTEQTLSPHMAAAILVQR